MSLLIAPRLQAQSLSISRENIACRLHRRRFEGMHACLVLSRPAGLLALQPTHLSQNAPLFATPFPVSGRMRAAPIRFSEAPSFTVTMRRRVFCRRFLFSATRPSRRSPASASISVEAFHFKEPRRRLCLPCLPFHCFYHLLHVSLSHHEPPACSLLCPSPETCHAQPCLRLSPRGRIDATPAMHASRSFICLMVSAFAESFSSPLSPHAF